jgi:methyltransferase-like protein/2-polyprenyl-3-methyl-5-hydroxy-6-metoxy-1,4-benzoquinol methylase
MNMVTTELTSYDEVPYPNYTYPQTHPDRLATLATLFGMQPAPVEHCRALELGCGDGSNLLPMAFGLPESEFVGVDLAAHPIANGNARSAALGLKNIELRRLDLMEIGKEIGQFDYIMVHGLYSWIPPAARDKILAICRSSLNPQGVAYISYNTYPGCHLREITRQLMLFHTKDVKDSRERIAQGRALIQWLADGQTQSSAYQTFLREVSERFKVKSHGAVFHDDLAEINAPVYFHQFVSHAAEHGLQFLSEADFFESQDYDFPEQLRHLAEQDRLTREQYLDFLKGRAFRQTLLCHHEISLDRSVKLDRVRRFYIKSEARPVSAAPDIKSTSVEEFRRPKEGSISTDFPLAKAALFHLSEIYPRSAHFDVLLAKACSLIGQTMSHEDFASDEDARTFAEVMLKTYGAGVIELHLHEPQFVVEPSEYPQASPLARLQAQQGVIITSLFPNTIGLEDDLGRHLLVLLDGTRNRPAVLDELRKMIDSNVEESPQDEEAFTERKRFLEALPDDLENQLNHLGRLGLLLA